MESTTKTQVRKICVSILLSLLILAGSLKADGEKWIVLHENIPDTAKIVSIKMIYDSSESGFYGHYKGNIISTEIEGHKKGGYEQQIDLGSGLDGYHYMVQIKEATDTDFIGDDIKRVCMVKVIRSRNDKKFETVKEGLLSFNEDLDIPMEVSPEATGLSFDKPIKGNIEIRISRNNNSSVYKGSCDTTLNGSLSGSTATEDAMIYASLMSSGSLAIKDRTLRLSVQPHDSKMRPISKVSKLTETFKLGSALVAVEKIAADNSEIVLSILSGQLTTPPEKVEILAEIDKPFPPFTRVELIKRKLITLDDLRSEAGPDGHIVMLFGDFKVSIPNYHSEQQMGFSLDATMIENILNKNCERPAVLAFVCRQLSLADLYGKWLDSDPDYHILADYSNPMMTNFLGSRVEPYMMMEHRSDEVESLRSQLRLDPNKIVTALIDGNGMLLYLNTDAGNELASSLVQINKIVQKDE